MISEMEKIDLIKYLSEKDVIVLFAKTLHQVEFNGFIWQPKEGVKYTVGVLPEIRKRREKMLCKSRKIVSVLCRELGMDEKYFHSVIYDIITVSKPEKPKTKRKRVRKSLLV